MIISITGASGVGKTTLMHNLLPHFPGMRPLESITTRPARESDEKGEYLYVSEAEFDDIEKRGEFLWEAQTYKSRYGTRKAVVDEALDSGMFIPILVIDAAHKLYEYAKAAGKSSQVHFLYVEIHDENELRKRFRERGDAQEEMEARIAECKSWDEQAHRGDVPFIFLHATKTREEILSDALAALRTMGV